MKLRPARHRDLPAIGSLLTGAGLPDEDISSHLATFAVGEHEGAVVAAGALEPLGTAALLRSVVIAPQFGGRGWGRRTTDRLLDQAQRLGIRDLYLLTTGASGFFAGMGFTTVPREAAPEPVRRTRQFTGLCPASAVLMHLPLPTE